MDKFVARGGRIVTGAPGDLTVFAPSRRGPATGRNRSEINVGYAACIKSRTVGHGSLGVRYDGSPIIVGDGTEAPPDSFNTYTPSACPGGRAPHAWLADESSLFDHFGREFTLLVTGDDAAPGRDFAAAAKAAGVPLEVLHLPQAGLRDLYEADLALIRPDQHVAWRGNAGSAEPADVLRRATGH